MANDQSSERSPLGRMEVMPNGQHRWVAASDPSPASPSADATLSYATPTPKPRRKPFSGVLGGVIGFIIGTPAGCIVGGVCVDLIWKNRQWQANPFPFAAAALFAAIGGALFVGAKRAFLAGLLFGAAFGLFVLCALLTLTSGMHHG